MKLRIALATVLFCGRDAWRPRSKQPEAGEVSARGGSKGSLDAAHGRARRKTSGSVE